jgi:hypothetical protein
MDDGILLVATSSLHSWELTLHYATTDPAIVMQLLAERYGFWTDDIPHPGPFDDLLTNA